MYINNINNFILFYNVSALYKYIYIYIRTYICEQIFFNFSHF